MKVHRHKTTAPEDESIWHEMTVTYDSDSRDDASLTVRGNVEVVAMALLMYVRSSGNLGEVKACGEEVRKRGPHQVLAYIGQMIDDGEWRK